MYKIMAEKQKAKIIVVDDEPEIVEFLAYELHNMGFNVLSAANGVDALNIIKKEYPQVVVTDMRMPRGMGLELIEKIGKIPNYRPKILLMSGYKDTSVEEAYDHGVSAFISKPFSRQQMMQLILDA